MAHRNEIMAAAGKLGLTPEKFQEITSPNGLQVEEAKAEINTLIHRRSQPPQAATADAGGGAGKADMVSGWHHGYFWKGETQGAWGVKTQSFEKNLANSRD